jgi:putative transposase
MTTKYKMRKKHLLHIYNRGNRKEKICKTQKDYFFLNNLIHYHFKEKNFDLLSFCIMPNHYHILAKQRGRVHISKVMQSIASRFTKHINEKHSLKGHLFQCSYKTKFILNDAQLQIVSHYIENNLKKIGEENIFPKFYSDETLLNYYIESFFKEKQ